MKKIYLNILVVISLVFLSFNVYALSIAPGDQIDDGLSSGVGNDNAAIVNYLSSEYSLVDFLYKSEVDEGAEEGALMGSYETAYFNEPGDPSAATITYIDGSYIDSSAYLVVKDGDNSPYWYLFNLSDLGWDGMETLELSNFWPSNGAISHVSLYGSSVPVPEPSSLILFGAGIAGLAVYRRKKS